MNAYRAAVTATMLNKNRASKKPEFPLEPIANQIYSFCAVSKGKKGFSLDDALA